MKLPQLDVQGGSLGLESARARLRQLPRLRRLLVPLPQGPRVVLAAGEVLQLPLEVKSLEARSLHFQIFFARLGCGAASGGGADSEAVTEAEAATVIKTETETVIETDKEDADK